MRSLRGWPIRLLRLPPADRRRHRLEEILRRNNNERKSIKGDIMPTLQINSFGPLVNALQQRLKDLGFDPNGIDGKFGSGTQTAVMDFQKSKGLQVDGKVGPDTMAALQLGAAPSGNSGAAAAPAVAANTGSLNLAGLAGKVPDPVIAQIPLAAKDFSINSNLRLAHFLAQCALESTGFTATMENLNYSAPRILVVFKKYFRNVDPGPYAHNPQRLGSHVYASRMGNGDE